MVLTRPQAKAAFHHVLDDVLGRGDDTPLKSSLLYDGIEDIFSLITIDTDTINHLTFEDPNKAGQRLPVPKGDKSLVRVFCAYVIHCNNIGTPINDNWSGITQTDFDTFRVDPSYVSSLHGGTTVPGSTAVSSSSAPSTATKYSPAELFRRGIKRDPSLFPTLKDEKFNDSWHRSFSNQARAQDVSEVLDPLYTPSTTEERDLFLEKQRFLYAVLEAKVAGSY